MRVVFFEPFSDFDSTHTHSLDIRAQKWMNLHAHGTHGKLVMTEYGFIELNINKTSYRLSFNNGKRSVIVYFSPYPVPNCSVMNVELVPTPEEMLLFNDYPKLFNISVYRELYLNYSTRSRAAMLPLPRTLVLKVVEYM